MQKCSAPHGFKLPPKRQVAGGVERVRCSGTCGGGGGGCGEVCGGNEASACPGGGPLDALFPMMEGVLRCVLQNLGALTVIGTQMETGQRTATHFVTAERSHTAHVLPRRDNIHNGSCLESHLKRFVSSQISHIAAVLWNLRGCVCMLDPDG